MGSSSDLKTLVVPKGVLNTSSGWYYPGTIAVDPLRSGLTRIKAIWILPQASDSVVGALTIHNGPTDSTAGEFASTKNSVFRQIIGGSGVAADAKSHRMVKLPKGGLRVDNELRVSFFGYTGWDVDTEPIYITLFYN